MNIYIDDMPKSCEECKHFRETFGVDNGYRCRFKQAVKNGTSAIFKNLEKLYNHCPFKSLKEHDKELINNISNAIQQELQDNTYLYFEVRKSTSPHNSGMEYEWFNFVRFIDFINKLFKEKDNDNR